MERQLGKLSISTTGLLGGGGGGDSVAHGQLQQQQQQQQQQRYLLQAQPQQQQQQQRRQPSSVHHLPLANGDDPNGDGDSTGLRQRTGRLRQERSSTWGGTGPRIGGYSGSVHDGTAAATSAELAETVDLRLQESPRTPRTPRAGGSPRYATPADDHNHLAAISPRGTAGHQAVHSYHRRDRNPSGSGLMVTEDDFRLHHTSGRDSGGSQSGGGGGGVDSGFGWQPPRSQNDVSARILQKYKTDSLHVETAAAPDQQQQQQQQQQHQRGRGQQQSTAAKLSKSHDGYMAPRRLPPISGAAGGADGQNDGDSGEELDDQEEDEDDNRRQRHRGGGSQKSNISASQKGRTRTT